VVDVGARYGTSSFVSFEMPVTGASLVNRIIKVEHFDDPSAAAVTGHYVVLHATGAAFGGATQSKVFYNSAAWLATDKLLLLERGPGHLHLVVADLTGATNLVGQPAKGEGNLDPESLAAGKGYAALGITPAATTLVFNSDDTPTFITNPPGGAIAPDKLEGLAVINKTTVAISNDNDFGIVNANDRSRIWILRLKAHLAP
jgi:alkaline phosphatase